MLVGTLRSWVILTSAVELFSRILQIFHKSLHSTVSLAVVIRRKYSLLDFHSRCLALVLNLNEWLVTEPWEVFRVSKRPLSQVFRVSKRPVEGVPSIETSTEEGVPSVDPPTVEGVPSVDPPTVKGVPSVDPPTVEGVPSVQCREAPQFLRPLLV